MVDDHLLAFELLPAETRIGLPGGQKEAVALVDLGEMQGWWLFALLEWAEALRWRGLGHVHAAIDQPDDGGLAGSGNRVARLQALVFQKAAGHGGYERRIERRKAGKFDADVVTQGSLRGRCRSQVKTTSWPKPRRPQRANLAQIAAATGGIFAAVVAPSFCVRRQDQHRDLCRQLMRGSL